MKKATIENDIATNTGRGDMEGERIPDDLQTVPIRRLRYDGNVIVDAAKYGVFYIDPQSVKHIVQHDPEWQEFSCSFDDELVNDSGTWRVMTGAERTQKQADVNAEQKIAAKEETLARTAAIESLKTDRVLPDDFVDPRDRMVSL